MQAPSSWSNPIVSASMMPSGQAYRLDSLNQIDANPLDVGILLGLDFNKTGGTSSVANTITLIADTDLAAGTAVSINSAGHAVQTWGPAPSIANTAILFSDQPPLRSGQAIVTTLPLSSGKFVAFVLSLSPTHQFASAQPFSVSGDVITLGTESTATALINVVPVFNSPNASRPTAAALTPSLFVTAFNDPGTGNLNVAACSIGDDGVITVGAAVQVDTQGSSNSAVVLPLNETHFLVSYVGNSDGNGQAVVGSVSAGPTITLGSLVPVAVSPAETPIPVKLTSSSVALVWIDGSTSFLTAAVGSVIGTGLTVGTPAAGSTIIGSVNAVALSATGVLATAHDQNYFVLATALSIIGTIVTVGTPIIAGPLATAGRSFPQALDATHAAITGFGPGYGPIVVAVAGPIVSIVATSVIAGKTFGELVPLTASEWMFTEDISFNIYEQTVSLISGRIAHPGVAQYWLYPINNTHVLAVIATAGWNLQARVVNASADIAGGPVGFTGSAIKSGHSGTITLAGTVSGFSGLTPGAYYYVNGDGTLTTANTGHSGGYALSASQIAIATAPQ